LAVSQPARAAPHSPPWLDWPRLLSTSATAGRHFPNTPTCRRAISAEWGSGCDTAF